MTDINKVSLVQLYKPPPGFGFNSSSSCMLCILFRLRFKKLITNFYCIIFAGFSKARPNIIIKIFIFVSEIGKISSIIGSKWSEILRCKYIFCFRSFLMKLLLRCINTQSAFTKHPGDSGLPVSGICIIERFPLGVKMEYLS